MELQPLFLEQESSKWVLLISVVTDILNFIFSCLDSCPRSLLVESIKWAGACTDSYVILEFYVGKQLNSYLRVLFAIGEKKISMVFHK